MGETAPGGRGMSGTPLFGLTKANGGRTMAVPNGGMMATGTKRTRSERLEVRTTPEDRALIDSAVAASGTDLSDFVVSNLTVASRRVLADRIEFALEPEAREAWEKINRRRARSLSGLRDLMARPTPFAEE